MKAHGSLYINLEDDAELTYVCEQPLHNRHTWKATESGTDVAVYLVGTLEQLHDLGMACLEAARAQEPTGMEVDDDWQRVR